MKKRYFTVGMAGHIDHGKTALTKALTNVDTDRLKEEKERQISIEPGFAPLYDDDRIQISIIDVPGHERFIRQMIAGVAGIDYVVLVIAADEGVMPQTLEHAEILSFLNIEHGCIVLNKIDKVDEEVLKMAVEDIQAGLNGTMFEGVPIFPVSSVTGEGCDMLKSSIVETLLLQPERHIYDTFRFPIDQVFTVKGQGTVVRGTIYEGSVKEGDKLISLPNQLDVKVRQIQVHHEQVDTAYAGQRTALNITGIPLHQMKRGDTLVSSNSYITSDTIDVNLSLGSNLKYTVKQRMPIKCYIGTTEVMGKIVFFDRNEVTMEKEDILCQLRLDSPIVAKRGDRFIIRRPSPFETIGGGWIIDPNGKRYKFGRDTITLLQKKKSGSFSDRLFSFLEEAKALEKKLILSNLSISQEELEKEIQHQEWIVYNDFVTHRKILNEMVNEMERNIIDFHHLNPLQTGLRKAELFQSIQRQYPEHLIEYCLKKGLEQGKWEQEGPYVFKKDFHPHLPEKWIKPMSSLVASLKNDNWKVDNFITYIEKSGIESNKAQEVIKFLMDEGSIVPLTPALYWQKDVFQYYVNELKTKTNAIFDMQEAKAILGFSRKYLVPFLEAMDREKLTCRKDGGRMWTKH
ncbi:translation elongation factor [Heyndrickxia shackletonii]|uniref:Selenocysteine-specific elongation factor n=1 Tax=Heyndrickxia shackletonii TaxID=157838 RepID=A0A0Q3TKH2_9BACI|nr:selenocysteine-specific translation elongation factor [Heyndrickxia shackletonii]KQL54480.1 translation elongation factor [Heyndrickxia shackletonii]NEY99206.1 selenocysteine-specific translation elongation factor [Heyndrickxia shackletonii]